MTIRSKTLYVTRNGLLEPLGQSQVLSYLKGLSRDYDVTLITYEKPSDLEDRKAVEELEQVCEAHGIRWTPQVFRSRPKYVASALSILRLVWLIWRAVRRDGVRLVHARSYIPAAAARLVWRLTRTPFIFDMRALWPEELITAGRLRRGSRIHRAIVSVERACLRDAAAVVTLTEASAHHLSQTYPKELAAQTMHIIPTCADLDHFSPGEPQERSGGAVHGCIGSVTSGWFQTGWLADWFAAVASNDPTARFEVITRDPSDRVRSAVDPAGILNDRLTISSSPFSQMPAAIRRHDCSVMFYAGGAISELGRSPTRMAEVLGCGRPVVVNEGVGDVAQIVRSQRVGVVLADPSPGSISTALDELAALRAEPDLSLRCRKAAEELFSLSAGVTAYHKIYNSVLNGDASSIDRSAA